jgi:hypothetical protein
MATIQYAKQLQMSPILINHYIFFISKEINSVFQWHLTTPRDDWNMKND